MRYSMKPWTIDPWGDGTANVEDADGNTICRDISLIEANTIVRAVNAHALLILAIKGILSNPGGRCTADQWRAGLDALDLAESRKGRAEASVHRQL